MTRSALVICCIALAGCSQPGPSQLQYAPIVRAFSGNGRTPTYHVLHNFGQYSSDGSYPEGGLVADASGTLYGTTDGGGASNGGTVFRINRTTNKEIVLHSFGSGSDGSGPVASMLLEGGDLYGTTTGRGAHSGGTIFRVTIRNDKEIVWHSFGASLDGATPEASLIDVKGAIYGTTSGGGPYFGGMVFKISLTTRKEQILHVFGGDSDGLQSQANLLAVNGTLFGTTRLGGAYAGGTVFSIRLKNHRERVLHHFGAGTDGKYPYAGLIDVNGTFYGTTYAGGTYDGGTVFSLDAKTHSERVVHSFGAPSDGTEPWAGLIDVKGTLYGVTASGGTNGDGILFSIETKTGTERVLHNFTGYPSDGMSPEANLIAINSTLYGTTNNGGAYYRGTAFAFTP